MNDQTNHRDHVLSRIYREGAWPEPSRQIDQAILAASRRERSFARRWAPSFAVAATVVLASTLALKVYREQPEVISPSPPDAASRDKQPSAPEKATETKAAETKPAAPAAPPVQPVATPQGFSSTMDAGEAERLDRIQRELDLKRGAPPSESPVAGYAAAQKSALAEKAAPALKKEASASASAPASAPRAAASKPVTPFASTREPVAPQPQALEANRDRLQASPPAAQAAPLPAPTVAAPAPAPAAPASGASAISGSALGTTTLMVNRAAPKASERSPQTWVEDIRKLMAAGRSEEAGQEIAEFKKRYPDYVLPEDLR